MSEHLIGNLGMGLDAPGPQMKGFIWGILGDQAGSENPQTKPLATSLLAFLEAVHLSPKIWKNHLSLRLETVHAETRDCLLNQSRSDRARSFLDALLSSLSPAFYFGPGNRLSEQY